jgi:Uma2 family endonuclease
MYRLTLDQYHGLIKSGILGEDDRVELLEGWLVEKLPQDPPHSGTVSVVSQRLKLVLGDAWAICEQLPITLGDSEPEPDVAVVIGPAERYFDHHPSKGEVQLLIEAADSSLDKDRLKAAIYASLPAPFYWIINLPERVVEVYGGPSPRKRTYREVRVYEPGEELPLIVDGVQRGVFRVDDLLPPLTGR